MSARAVAAGAMPVSSLVATSGPVPVAITALSQRLVAVHTRILALEALATSGDAAALHMETDSNSLSIAVTVASPSTAPDAADVDANVASASSSIATTLAALHAESAAMALQYAELHIQHVQNQQQADVAVKTTRAYNRRPTVAKPFATAAAAVVVATSTSADVSAALTCSKRAATLVATTPTAATMVTATTSCVAHALSVSQCALFACF